MTQDMITPHLSVLDCTSTIRDLLFQLHELSISQTMPKSVSAMREDHPDTFDTIVVDKLVALDPDKCAFLYNLIIANDARNIIEAGTSWGVSTIWWALAVGENVKRRGGDAKVIATEKESSKSQKARENWKTCGNEVERFIELREGDILETWKSGVGEVDLLLLDSKLTHCFT
jgi:predicted O-methyltransferase YrrM